MGGPQALVDACIDRLHPDTIRYASPVHAIRYSSEQIHLQFGEADEFEPFDRVIVAVPPRIAVRQIEWATPLPARMREVLNAVPTWMASHAKAVILYDTTFWRERGMSGRIASQVGPLVEAHDHCGPAGTPAALFGFVGVPADVRATMTTEDLSDAIRAQLIRCWGTDSPSPRDIRIEDWSRDPFTASPQDLMGPMMHPEPGPSSLRDPLFDGRLRFAGAEVAAQSAGLIEGALIAAEHAVRF